MDRRTLDRWIAQWLRGTPLRDRRVTLGWLGVQLISVLAVAPLIARVIRPVVHDPRPPKLVDGPGDMRFGLPEATRRDIFRELAGAEPNAREQGLAGFPGQPWSQEDHRCAFERNTTRDLAARRKLNLQVVYLVLDEGIRNKWPGPDGKPLIATTIPLDPRRR